MSLMEQDKDEIVAKLAGIWDNWIVKQISLDDRRNTDLLIAAMVQAISVHAVNERNKQ